MGFPKSFFLALVIALLMFGCASSLKSSQKGNQALAKKNYNLDEKLVGMSDRSVTLETIALFNNLKEIAKKGFIFGQHSPTYDHQTGIFPVTTNLKSDCFTSVKSHPGIFNFDFDRDRVDFFKVQVEEIFRRGGIVSYSWHANNPVTGGHCKDTTQNPVQSILSEGIGWTNWKAELDKIADYFNNLEVEGVKVPIIFRPFHEHTGNWFWWGAKHCSSEEFVALWKKTVDYLRQAGVNNILLAYSPSRPSSTLEKTLETYPGDHYADIIGLDVYEPDSATLKKLLNESVDFAVKLAQEKHKVAAITEVGVTKGLQNSDTDNWFMDTLLNPLKANSSMDSIAFICTWFNARHQYWVPLPNQPNYKSFLNFYNDPSSFFLNDLPNMYRLD